MRMHRKVWVWWGRGWAAQYYRAACASFGVHLDYRRGLVDVHATPLLPVLLVAMVLGGPAWLLALAFLPTGVLTLALGPDAHITSQADRHRHSCRGFLFADDPHL
jgi:hypothetical protein